MALKRLVSLVAVGVVALGTASCGSDGGSSGSEPTASSDYKCSEPNADKMTDITVTGMPILSNAVLFAGDEEGIFEKHGLNLTMEMVASPPATISALAGGNSDFAWVTTINLLQAITQGQDVRGVAPHAGVEPGFFDKMTAGEKGYERGVNALLVADDSDIQDVTDLKGKTVAVSDPAFAMVLVKAFIDMKGGDSSDIKYVIMPPADSYAALMAGQVDAAHSIEPFTMNYQADGLRNLGWLEAEIFKEGVLMSFMVANNDFIDENPETVERFRCAMTEANAFGNTHHDELRAATAKEQNADPSKLQNQLVPYFFTGLEAKQLDQVQELMVKYGIMDSELPLERFLTTNVMQSASE